VRCATNSSLPELKGKRLLLHEDSQPVIVVATHFTLNSPTMIFELRNLYLLIDTYEIKIRTFYIRSATSIWAVNLSRVTDNSDWQLAPRKFKHFGESWSSHTVERFASFANSWVSRYNGK
jgi:hypothetical protein